MTSSSKAVELDKLYQTYKSDPTPDNLAPVVEHLTPAINYSLSSFNAGGDALLRNKARMFAADAVKKYDPQYGASLPTWVSGQLMQLGRFKRTVNQPVKVPERTQLDAYTLSKAEKDFFDRFDREPDLEELSDFAKMPVKRIEKIRRSFRATPSQAVLSNDMAAASEPDFAAEATDYVYKDADAVDRKILEMKTGYGGKYDPMEPKRIAVLLGLTPSQLTRRSAKLSLRIQDAERTLQGLQ